MEKEKEKEKVDGGQRIEKAALKVEQPVIKWDYLAATRSVPASNAVN